MFTSLLLFIQQKRKVKKDIDFCAVKDFFLEKSHYMLDVGRKEEEKVQSVMLEEVSFPTQTPPLVLCGSLCFPFTSRPGIETQQSTSSQILLQYD